MKKLILAAVVVIALLFALGSMGAYDTIGFGQAFIQVGIAAVVAFLAMKALRNDG